MSALTTLTKPRVRLTGVPAPKSKPKAAVAPSKAESEANSGLTPEALAYALPGGLARLAFKGWRYAPYIKFIEDKYLGILNGQPTNILFSAPPRHGKTMFLDRVIPAHYLGRNPDKRVLLITYNSDFSRTQSRAARNIMRSYGKKVFGVEVSDESATANHWELQGRMGGMESVGAGGAITGKGADLLLVDDLIKGYADALNEKQLDEMWEWFKTDVYTRLEPNASVIIIGTRWSLYDVIGRIQSAAEAQSDDDEGFEEENPFEDWETINFPALATENDLLGRAPGEALFPERYPASRLRKIKAVQDDYWFEALFQGNPVPLKGEIINVEWFRHRYADALPRNEYEYIVVSADTANKDTELADFSVLQVWGVKEGQYHLLDVIREKMQYPALLDVARGLGSPTGHWRPEFFLIEDKGSGTNLIQNLRAEGQVNVWPVDPGSESKILRMQAETAALREGKVWLPKEASWLETFMMEMRSFPRGKKDQVDATSQFLRFMRQNSSGVTMW